MTRITKKLNPNWKRTSRPQGAEVANIYTCLPKELIEKWRSIPRKGQWVDGLLREGEREVSGEKENTEKIPIAFSIDAALLEKWRAIPNKGQWLAGQVRIYEQKTKNHD